jgi:hypothetical protein
MGGKMAVWLMTLPQTYPSGEQKKPQKLQNLDQFDRSTAWTKNS